MKTPATTSPGPSVPPLWAGIAILGWGGLSGHPLVAGVMAVAIELTPRSSLRLDLKNRLFYQVADFCTVVFALLAAYQFADKGVFGIYEILALLPVCLYPLVFAQRLSLAGTTPASALFVSMRRGVRSGDRADRALDLTPPFILGCVLAAAVTQRSGGAYMAFFGLVLAGFLLARRPRRFAVGPWLAALAVAVTIAAGVSAAAGYSRGVAESVMYYWFNQMHWLQGDPDRAVTAIGAIGRLKLSDRIRVRVYPSGDLALPLRLHEASYDTFRNGIWSTAKPATETLDPQTRGTWRVGSQNVGEREQRIAVALDRPRDVGLASLPVGSRVLSGDAIIELQRNRFGTVILEAVPGPLHYVVDFSGGAHQMAGGPTEGDLEIPDAYTKVITDAVASAGATHLPPAEAVARIERYFAGNFHYTLVQNGFFPGRMPLATFLTHTRAGHCEYFASATVLMLRALGIPSRYSVGYVIDEYSALEQALIARARHGHAWASAWVNGRWVTVDTTPSTWLPLESENASQWQHVQDLWTWTTFRLQRWRQGDREQLDRFALLLVPPLAAVLVWRLAHRARRLERGGERRRRKRVRRQGHDSPVYRLLRKMDKAGLTLLPGETTQQYFARHESTFAGNPEWRELLELHYAYRFAPAGTATADRRTLRGSVKRLLRQLRQLRQRDRDATA